MAATLGLWTARIRDKGILYFNPETRGLELLLEPHPDFGSWAGRKNCSGRLDPSEIGRLVFLVLRSPAAVVAPSKRHKRLLAKKQASLSGGGSGPVEAEVASPEARFELLLTQGRLAFSPYEKRQALHVLRFLHPEAARARASDVGGIVRQMALLLHLGGRAALHAALADSLAHGARAGVEVPAFLVDSPFKPAQRMAMGREEAAAVDEVQLELQRIRVARGVVVVGGVGGPYVHGVPRGGAAAAATAEGASWPSPAVDSAFLAMFAGLQLQQQQQAALPVVAHLPPAVALPGGGGGPVGAGGAPLPVPTPFTGALCQPQLPLLGGHPHPFGFPLPSEAPYASSYAFAGPPYHPVGSPFFGLQQQQPLLHPSVPAPYAAAPQEPLHAMLYRSPFLPARPSAEGPLHRPPVPAPFSRVDVDVEIAALRGLVLSYYSSAASAVTAHAPADSSSAATVVGESARSVGSYTSGSETGST